MVLTNVLITVVTFSIIRFVIVHVLTCNNSVTIQALLDSITNNICFALKLGSISEVILKASLAKEFSIALFTNYFFAIAFLIFCVGEAR